MGDWRNVSDSGFYHAVHLAVCEGVLNFSSAQIAELFDSWHKLYGFALRMQFTAGWGCTVMELFERDRKGPQVPLQRVIL